MLFQEVRTQINSFLWIQDITLLVEDDNKNIPLNMRGEDDFQWRCFHILFNFNRAKRK